MNQYGHFVVETLPTLWPLVEDIGYDNVVFHPFVFGSQMTAYASFFLDLFQIRQEQVIVLQGPARFEQIDVPERLVWLNHSANLQARTVFKFIRQKLLNSIESPPQPKPYYLSRLRNSLAKGNRAVANEAFIENQFRQFGFEIIYPERMSLSQQLARYSTATVLAGITGSALHNCLFMQKGSRIIEIGDFRSSETSHPMQAICSELAQADSTFVPFSGWTINETDRGVWFRTSTLPKQLSEFGEPNKQHTPMVVTLRAALATSALMPLIMFRPLLRKIKKLLKGVFK